MHLHQYLSRLFLNRTFISESYVYFIRRGEFIINAKCLLTWFAGVNQILENIIYFKFINFHPFMSFHQKRSGQSQEIVHTRLICHYEAINN